jgi:hypothetical protein
MEDHKVLNQRMITHVGIIDGTLLEKAVWASLFPFHFVRRSTQ